MWKPCLVLLLLFVVEKSVVACELIMGYRTNAKPPFINAAPDNSGLYFDLYEEAARRIDCRLIVLRQPKRRILHFLKHGDIDFYPGLSFSEERAQYVTFIPNGLKDGYIGLTRRSEPEIFSLNDVAKRNLVMVMAFGGYDLNAEDYGIHVRRPYDFTLEQIVDLIIEGRADFHAYNLLAVQHFLSNHPDKAAKLRMHQYCCSEPEQMYMAFSKQSAYAEMIDNADYLRHLPLTAENTPDSVSISSIAWKLRWALSSMQKDGSFQVIYGKYFGGAPMGRKN